MPNLACHLVRRLAIAAALSAIHGLSAAQCTNVWRPGGSPGTNGLVNTSTWWDPDGAGPATPLWVVGGNFQQAGDELTSNVAAYDPAAGTWSALGTGLAARVTALAVDSSGALIAGVGFGNGGGSLVRWNGATWTPFAPGMVPISPNPLASGEVTELAVMPNGDLIAAGHMHVFGVAGAVHIARWNGTSWSALGSGSAVTEGCRAVAVLSNGDIVAGGTFTGPSGSIPGIARWNGTSWSSLGAGAVAIRALAELPNGDVIAAGSFSTIGGVAAANIARWDGTSWSPLGAGINFVVEAITPLASGGFAAGGVFWSAGGAPASKVARWDGVQWSSYGPGLGIGNVVTDRVNTLVELPNGHLAAAGNFTTSGTTPLSRVAIWNGASWLPLGSGFTVLPGAVVLATAIAPNGDLIVGGNFVAATVPGANCIARWNGSSWSALGAGFQYDDGNPPVYAVTVMPNGDVVAAGQFQFGVPGNVSRWDGTTWSLLGAGFPTRVTSLLLLPSGELLAAGDSGAISSWNGTVWTTIGSGFNGTVTALVRMPNGDVIAGGVFTGSVRRYDGTTWSTLGGGVGQGVRAVTVMPNGDIVVGGGFTTAGGAPANRIARWNGSTWSPLGTGVNFDVMGLEALPNGDLVATGLFMTAGGVQVNGIARWNGTTWSAFGAGFGNGQYGATLRMLDDGQLLVGGAFVVAGGHVSPYVVRLDTTCPAAVSATGVGCPSSGGNNVLAADTLPWIGATFTATGTGLPSVAFVVAVTGFTAIPQGVAPLSLAFPQAGPGCDVLAAPDILGLLVTTTGTVQSSIVFPNAPSLIGGSFHHQLVPIEVDPTFAFVSVTATNALQLTPGTF